MGPCGDYLSYYKAGKLRVLATSSFQRNPYLPNVPTFAEQELCRSDGEGGSATPMPGHWPGAHAPCGDCGARRALRKAWAWWA
jgi:hypothetical protein